MLHAVLYIVFIAIATKWLSFELKMMVSYKKYGAWVIAAVGAALAGSVLSIAYGPYLGNFFLHSVGGGVAGAFLFQYLTNTFGFRANWRLELAALFLFVSAVGVMNELLEFVLEVWGFGIMSIDNQDTWRDFVANTTGAFLAFGTIRLFIHFKARQKQG